MIIDENKLNNINHYSDLSKLLFNIISNEAGNILLDFSSKKDSDYYLTHVNNQDIVELEKIKNISHDMSKKVILTTYSGKIENLHFYAEKIDKIMYYQILDFQKVTSSNLITFNFQWTNFDISASNFPLIISYIEHFIVIYFDNFKYRKPLFLFSNGYDINRIKKDIAYFKHSAVLTSRLAIFIYKICRWNFNISKTKVGKEFALYYSKSKVYNDKKFDIKNTKAYFIHTMSDYRIIEERLRIVKYLLYNHTDCTLYTLSQATGIPIEQLKTL